METTIAFLVTWLLLALVCGWVMGGAAKLGGPDDPRH
jgi:hypothetical protein